MPYGSDPTVPPAGAGGYGKDPTAPTAKPEEGLSRFLPSFMKGPSVWEQLATEGSNMQEEKQRLGRDLTQSEIVHLALQNPIAMGFGTHQIGGPADIAANMAARAQKSVGPLFNKAVQPPPSSVGATAPQKAEYQQKARGAADSIVANKANLEFVDPKTGDKITGKSPQSVEQLGEAIAQTKKEIFDKYDLMAKQAGQAGIRVPLSNPLQELNVIANDRVLNIRHSKDANYAREQIAQLQQLGSMSPSEMQIEIQKLNSKLSSFYKNPKASKVGRAHIDAMLANAFRNDLDITIANSGSFGYQALKNEYGNLSAIEKDVVRQAQKLANKEAGGFINRFVDIASGAEVLHGILLGNPATVVAGLSTKAAALATKWLRSPHRAVKNMFEAAEGQQMNPSSPVVPSTPLSPFMLSNQPNPGPLGSVQ